MKIPIWLRFFCLCVVFQALLVGSSVIQPTLLTLVLPWEASPLNARFIGALYCMGAISAGLCMFARRYADIRISLIEIGIVTGGLLLITVPHFAEFSAANFPYRWTLFYIIDPLAVSIILGLMRGRDPAPAGRNPLSAVFLIYAVILGLAGIVLLRLPNLVVSVWPWALPPILGQVYSIFFLTFAIGALLAARQPRWSSVNIYVAANLGMFVLILGVSVLHFSRFKAGRSTRAWFLLWTLGVIGFAIALIQRLDQKLNPKALA